MALSSKGERERRLAAKRALKQQRRSRRTAARGAAGLGSDGSASGGEFEVEFGAPGTVFLTAPLIRELSQLRGWPIDRLLIARSRGGFWSRQQDSVLLPPSPATDPEAEAPHDAYISELASADRRLALQGDDTREPGQTLCRSVSCPEADCHFRVRFESVCVPGEELADVPVLVHLERPERCDNCLEESLHQLESNGLALCAHCGSPGGGFAPATHAADEDSQDEDAPEG